MGRIAARAGGRGRLSRTTTRAPRTRRKSSPPFLRDCGSGRAASWSTIGRSRSASLCNAVRRRTSCSWPVKGTRTTRSTGRSAAPSVTRRSLRDVFSGGASMKRTLADFAKECGGTLQGADRSFSGVSSDTRTLKPGELFVALRGPRFDANQFVSAAQSAGAAGAVVDSPQERPQSRRSSCRTRRPRSSGSDTAGASQFAIPVIGVAGSNGKTTAKEMTATILAQAGSCLATRGNLEQPHRRAADAAAHRAGESVCRHRNGRESRRRGRSPGAHRASHRRPDHQRRR